MGAAGSTASSERRRSAAGRAKSTRDLESERILAGIGLVLLAVACFATLDTATKSSTAAVPILMGVWFRYAFQAVATTLVLLPLHGTRAAAHRSTPSYQLLRGALLLASSTLAFLSLRYMPLAEFTSIVLIAPLVITLLAATTLKEQVSPLRWALVAGGFVGTLVILRPGGEAFSWAMLLPLGLVLTNAWFQVLTSKLAQHREPAHDALLHRLGRHAARLAGAALRVDRAAALALVGAAVPHGLHGHGRATSS